MIHKSDDALAAQAQTILRIANSLKDLTAPYSCPPTRSPPVINSISLPNPQPLLPSLLKAGASQEVATAASKIYQTRAEELRRHIQESITMACRQIAGLPVVTSASSSDLLISKVVVTFTGVYLRRLDQWKEEIIERVKQTPKMPPKADQKNSRTFNHEYVPLLEHFFEENPFPSHADKVFLAKKSNMQYRQIHVWFQNRRNRTKKEDKPFRKKPISEGATKPLDKLYERMKGYIVQGDVPSPPRTQAFSPGGDSRIAPNTPLNDVFSLPPPPHAFPSPYPPTCHYDPFPCKTSPFSFSEPEWRRVSSTKPPSPLASIDDLTEMFSQLNVRGDSQTKCSSRLQSYAATAAITIIPSRAPHPSLIPIKDPYPAPTIMPYPSVCACDPHPRVFRSPSPTSKPVSLIPPSVPGDGVGLPGKRTTAPLPQRIPRRTRKPYRPTPEMLESSSTASRSPSIFSGSDSRNFSFSSVSSSPSPLTVASMELPYLSGPSRCSPFVIPMHCFGEVFGDTTIMPLPPVS